MATCHKTQVGGGGFQGKKRLGPAGLDPYSYNNEAQNIDELAVDNYNMSNSV